MGQHPHGTGNLIDEVSRRRRLGCRQDLALQSFLYVLRCAARLGSNSDRRCSDITEQPDRYLTVEEDVFNELHNLSVTRADGQATQCWIPDAPDLTALGGYV